MRALLWEIDRLQGRLVQIYSDLGVRSEFDAAFARDIARAIRGKLTREPAVAADAARWSQAKRQEVERAKHMSVGWAEFYGVHSFHGPPLPQSDGRRNRVNPPE